MKNLMEFLIAGMSMMTPEIREERISNIVEGNTIDGAALAALIDEVKVGAEMLLTGNEEKVPNPQEVRSMLESLDGKKEVARMEADEIVDLVIALRVVIGEAAEVERAIN